VSSGGVQVWNLSAHGLGHRVEVTGSASRTVVWRVNGRVVAVKKSSEDTVRLAPGDRLPRRGSAAADADLTPATDAEQADVGRVRVTFTGLGRPRRVTWYPADDRIGATVRTLVGQGGIDLDPEPGSPAAQREERIRRHPRRYAALAVAAGIGKVLAPLLLGLLAVRLLAGIPWPDWNLPSLPSPDVALPSIPLPDITLPSWQAPGWVSWLADRAHYVWPVLLAAFLARAEIRRRRQQDALKARLKAEALDHGGRADPPSGQPADPAAGRSDGPGPASAP